MVQPASKRSSLMHAILWGGLDRTHEDGSTEKHANPFKRICCFVLLANIRRLLRSRLFTSGNKRDIFFNVNAKKEKRQNASCQMTSVFLLANTRDR